MRRKMHLALLALGLLLVTMTGCDVMSERFLPENADDPRIANDALPIPATSKDPFTFLESTTLKRGGTITLQAGYYNAQPMRASVFVGGPDTPIGFGTAKTKNTIFCRDARNYEYTLEFNSPLVDVDVGEATGFKVIITDNNGIMAENITCPISLLDTQSGKVLYTKDLAVIISS